MIGKLLVLLGIVLALMVSACSGDDNSGNNQPTDTPQPTETPSPTPTEIPPPTPTADPVLVRFAKQLDDNYDRLIVISLSCEANPKRNTGAQAQILYQAMENDWTVPDHADADAAYRSLKLYARELALVCAAGDYATETLWYIVHSKAREYEQARAQIPVE